VELLAPFTLSIAQSWCNTFQTNMFTTFEQRALTVVRNLLTEVEEDCAPGLKDYAATQAELCIEMTKVALDRALHRVTASLNLEQRELSRSMAPNVQEGLRKGYDDALNEKGKGCVARQKVRTICTFLQWLTTILRRM
jgi:hypothetical protein